MNDKLKKKYSNIDTIPPFQGKRKSPLKVEHDHESSHVAATRGGESKIESGSANKRELRQERKRGKANGGSSSRTAPIPKFQRRFSQIVNDEILERLRSYRRNHPNVFGSLVQAQDEAGKKKKWWELRGFKRNVTLLGIGKRRCEIIIMFCPLIILFPSPTFRFVSGPSAPPRPAIYIYI